MNDKIKIVAMEGPCRAGKSTLSSGLIEQFSYHKIDHILDYAEFAGGGKNLPPPASLLSLNEEKDALDFLLNIEVERASHCRKSERIIIDRSVHTLLAHCYAIDKMRQLPYFQLANMCIYSSKKPIWPHKILYLDVSQEEIQRRNNGKFPQDSIFINSEFNAWVKDYFINLQMQFPELVTILNANLSIHEIRSNAKTLLDDLNWA
jgi:thymidylate kinase